MTDGRDAGFTLLEMLVALVVFGLLMAGLAQTMRYGVSVWSAETRASAGPQDMAATEGALRRLIEQAAPGNFIGQPGQLAFTAPLPAGVGAPDRLADVAVLVLPGGELALRWAPHPAGVALGSPPPPVTELLASGVTGLRAQYLMPQPDGSAAWTQDVSGDVPPLLVRLDVTFGDGREWPALVAAPVASGS